MGRSPSPSTASRNGPWPRKLVPCLGERRLAGPDKPENQNTSPLFYGQMIARPAACSARRTSCTASRIATPGSACPQQRLGVNPLSIFLPPGHSAQTDITGGSFIIADGLDRLDADIAQGLETGSGASVSTIKVADTGMIRGRR